MTTTTTAVSPETENAANLVAIADDDVLEGLSKVLPVVAKVQVSDEELADMVAYSSELNRTIKDLEARKKEIDAVLKDALTTSPVTLRNGLTASLRKSSKFNADLAAQNLPYEKFPHLWKHTLNADVVKAMGEIETENGKTIKVENLQTVSYSLIIKGELKEPEEA